MGLCSLSLFSGPKAQEDRECLGLVHLRALNFQEQLHLMTLLSLHPQQSLK